MSFIIGIDNGISGAIAILSKDFSFFSLSKKYVKKCISYTKQVQHITRIDVSLLKEIIVQNVPEKELQNTVAYLERPLVNPSRFKATQSAMRALEATLIVLEDLDIQIKYCDSKEWQKYFFNNIAKGMDTKEMSRQKGIQLFPQYRELIEKQDADALLIAQYFFEREVNSIERQKSRIKK